MPKRSEPISWVTAEKVAARVSGFEPFSTSYLGASLESDFGELTRIAEELVVTETGLVAKGPARARVTDRPGWAKANVASFRRLLKPIIDRPTDAGAASSIEKSSVVAPVGRALTGAQLGLVLGWMSGRVLGQYDLLLLEDENPQDQDIVYYVGPNILALEKRFAFPPREFRLWIALHECTHRAQFTGVSWLAGYFREQVNAVLAISDPAKLDEAIKKVVSRLRSGNNPIADGGILAMLAPPEQQDALKRIFGLMALLEGHGEVTMSRAGRDLIPSADRFHRVMHQRRSSARGLARFIQRLLGMDAKLKQYAEGERFLLEIERIGGVELARKVWESPRCLPTIDEIRDPREWTRRMGTAGSVA